MTLEDTLTSLLQFIFVFSTNTRLKILYKAVNKDTKKKNRFPLITASHSSHQLHCCSLSILYQVVTRSRRLRAHKLQELPVRLEERPDKSIFGKDGGGGRRVEKQYSYSNIFKSYSLTISVVLTKFTVISSFTSWAQNSWIPEIPPAI